MNTTTKTNVISDVSKNKKKKEQKKLIDKIVNELIDSIDWSDVTFTLPNKRSRRFVKNN